MPAYKVLPVLLVVLLVVLTAGFYFMEDMRPAFVERMFLNAEGFGPAKTPNEALDKFKEAIRKRNFKAAASLCGGEYAEELRKAAKPAKKLGDAVEDLLHNVKNVAGLNAPKAELAVRLLYPFPNDFKVLDIKHKDGADEATAVILLVNDYKDFKGTAEDLMKSNMDYRMDPRIVYSVTPRPWDGGVLLKLEGAKQKSWKVHLPVSTALRESITYLRDSGGNYTRALDNVKYAIKHDAAAKGEFERELQKQLQEAK